MITHQGVAYWTTQELANSLAARGIIDPDTSDRRARQDTQRWAKGVDLRPSARTPTGGLLWGVEECQAAMDEWGA